MDANEDLDQEAINRLNDLLKKSRNWHIDEMDAEEK